MKLRNLGAITFEARRPRLTTGLKLRNLDAITFEARGPRLTTGPSALALIELAPSSLFVGKVLLASAY